MSTLFAIAGTVLVTIQAARMPFSWVTFSGLVLLGVGWIMRAVTDWRRSK